MVPETRAALSYRPGKFGAELLDLLLSGLLRWVSFVLWTPGKQKWPARHSLVDLQTPRVTRTEPLSLGPIVRFKLAGHAQAPRKFSASGYHLNF